MIDIKNFNIYNMENALRGARNPLNSWNKIDSHYDENNNYILGQNDMGLLIKLCKAGSDHRKFMRQILLSVDITAPLYWWKEFDTYKVGTVANSTSTMHKIHSNPFSIDDFSHDHLDADSLNFLESMVNHLEKERMGFIETKDKQNWWNMIQLLPSSYNQMRTCTMSYENLVNIYFARRNHKLTEWHVFCDWVEKLPYGMELICQGSKKNND